MVNHTERHENGWSAEKPEDFLGWWEQVFPKESGLVEITSVPGRVFVHCRSQFEDARWKNRRFPATFHKPEDGSGYLEFKYANYQNLGEVIFTVRPYGKNQTKRMIGCFRPGGTRPEGWEAEEG